MRRELNPTGSAAFQTSKDPNRDGGRGEAEDEAGGKTPDPTSRAEKPIAGQSGQRRQHDRKKTPEGDHRRRALKTTALRRQLNLKQYAI